MLGCALAAHGVAQADWVIPAGGVVDAPAGAISLACTDLQVAGVLTIGAGASITDVRNVHIQPGGSLQVASGGSLQLAQQWRNDGNASATGAQVVRVASADCPTVGTPGPINVSSPDGTFAATPIPTLSGAALSGLAVLLGGLAWRTRRRTSRITPPVSTSAHSPR